MAEIPIFIKFSIVYPNFVPSTDLHVVKNIFTCPLETKFISTSKLKQIVRSHKNKCISKTCLRLPEDFDIVFRSQHLHHFVEMFTGNSLGKSAMMMMSNLDFNSLIVIGDNWKYDITNFHTDLNFYFYLFSRDNVDVRGQCVFNHPADWLCEGCQWSLAMIKESIKDNKG